MSFITKTQQNSLSPVAFVMDKNILKLIPKVSGDPLFNNDTIWQRVGFIFKHTNSSKRFTPSFRNLTSSKTARLKTGMNPGDSFKLKKIIIKSNQSYLVIKENEIPNVINFDFTLLNTQSPQTVRLGYSSLFNDKVFEIIRQSDGKLVIGGLFTTYNGTSANRIIRLNTDGSVDTSFDIGTGFDTSVNKILQQSDGKLVVAGGFSTYKAVINPATGGIISGHFVKKIVRLNTDGSLDTSFNAGSGFNNPTTSIIQQSDGKFVVGGTFTTYNGTSANRIVRLNTDGSVDTSFNAGTGFNAFVNRVLKQTDGKLVVAGGFTTYNGTSANRIIRLNNDGTRDNSFNIGAEISNAEFVYEMIQQSDGKIIIGGDVISTYNGISANKIVRLNTDGSLDTSFNAGSGFNNPPTSIIQQSDGKLVVGGTFTTYNGISANRIIRLNTNGTRDSSFNTGTGFNNRVDTILQQPDGKFLIVGDFTKFDQIVSNKIAKLNIDGTKDLNTFIGSVGFDNTVLSILKQADGKIVVGGNFLEYNGISANRIIRINSDNSIDTSFNIGTGFNNKVNLIIQQSDGKLVVGGTFTTYNGVYANKIVRLNIDGTRDGGFNIGIEYDQFVTEIFSIIQQSDGRLVVGGELFYYNENTGDINMNIVRLNANGSIDSSFNTGQNFENKVRSIIQQNSGDLIVGGDFTLNIKKINTNGNNISGFIENIGSGFNSKVRSIIQQSDGKLVIGGDFTTLNQISANRIVRLNPDGTRDSSFNTGTGIGGVAVHSIIQQSDGKLVIGGEISLYNSPYSFVSANKILRLNIDGTRDNEFVTGTGFNSPAALNLPVPSIYSIIQQADGRLVMGGYFKTYNSVNFDHIIRLESNGSLEIL
jgi:uncharacterized delta-60 repeat protein